VQLVNARVRSRRSVAADLGEEDPDGELVRIVEEAQRLAALGEVEQSRDRRGEEPEGDGDAPPAEEDRESQEARSEQGVNGDG
jgi:hypothetical protein